MHSLYFRIFISLSALLLSCDYFNIDSKASIGEQVSFRNGNHEVDLSALRAKAKMAKQYAEKKNLDTNFYFLIDLKRHSGLKRFYIWDFNRDTILNNLMVSHGCGDNPWGSDFSKELAPISNIDGSHASSI